MTRRSGSQQKSDDTAFPVRVKFAVPPRGLGALSDAMHIWLREHLGTGNYAVHSAAAIGTQAVGIYFLRIEDARRFSDAFPDLPLADGTLSSAFISCYKR